MNKHEVAVCLHLLRQLARPEHMEKLNAKRTPMSPQPIGLITMYRGQKTSDRRGTESSGMGGPTAVDAVRIDTVDSYQGSEKLY
ncbi:AAA domain-containing protein [Pseudomonas aeruginosa]